MNLEDLKKILLKKEEIALPSDLKKIRLIKELFKNENCFFEIDVDLAFNILLFLGIKKDEVKDVYYDLTDIKNFKKGKLVDIL